MSGLRTAAIAAMSLALPLALSLWTGRAAAGATVDAIQQRDRLRCGVSTGVSGFSTPDSQGVWTGLDADICRAIAAALLGDPAKASFVPLSPQQRIAGLQSGEVDVLTRNTTWTLMRDAQGMNFGPVVYFDGQGFLVPRSLGVTSASHLDGATVCLQPGTTHELTLADWARANGLTLQTVVIDSLDEVENAFFAGRCDVLTQDVSALAGARSVKAAVPDDYLILPETISKEPLAPIVRHGDDRWFDIVKWTVNALIEAEERGVTRDNVDALRAGGDPNIQRLLGVQGGIGEALGLDDAWAYRAIKAVGNYGEIFTRNVGPGTPLGLDRGLNALWLDGGLIYAPPIR